MRTFAIPGVFHLVCARSPPDGRPCLVPNALARGRRSGPSPPMIRPFSERWYGRRTSSGVVRTLSKATCTCPARKASGSPRSRGEPLWPSPIPRPGARDCVFWRRGSWLTPPACLAARTSIDSRSGFVRPPVEKPERPRPAHTAPSSVARELLRSAAEAIDNRRLRETLLRMSGARPAESPQNDGPARRPGARLDLTRAEGMPPVTAATGGRGAGPASG